MKSEERVARHTVCRDSVRSEERRGDTLVRLTARNIISTKFPSLRVGDRPSYPQQSLSPGRTRHEPPAWLVRQQATTDTHTPSQPPPLHAQQMI